MSNNGKNYYFEYDSEGNITKMVEIENTDHGNSKEHINPHAHDIDINKPYSNESRGPARELTEKEKDQNWPYSRK